MLLKYSSNAHELMLWRGHMLMILARLVCSKGFWAVAEARAPHTGPEPGYTRQAPEWEGGGVRKREDVLRG